MKFFLMILCLTAEANGAINFCDIVQDAKTTKTIPVPDNINYFIRGSAETGEIGFASGKGNILLDSKTGNKITVPGEIDPILTPDGKILGVPQSMLFDPKTNTYSAKPKNYEGLEIYQGRVRSCLWNPCAPTDKKVDDLEKSGEPYVTQVMTFYSRNNLDKPLFIDKDAKFSYQSFGQLRKSRAITAYRMLFETHEGIRARDYEFNETTKTFRPSGPVKTLCEGLRGYIPAQSKTGDEYSAYDAEKGVTHVFSIGKSGYDCKIKETLPGMVGKIDFSPDGKRLAYHVDKSMDNNNSKNVINSAGVGNNIESVLFDRETKTPAVIAKSSNTNSYYPIFLDNNTVAYIDSTKIESWQTKPQFNVKLVELQKMTTPKCARCFETGTTEEQKAALIGVMRDKLCESEPKFYFKNGIPSFSNLRVSQCQSVVDSCDSKCFADIKVAIARVSSPGGMIINGVSSRATQKWDVQSISKIEKSNLSAFCRDLVKENTVAPSAADQQHSTR